MTAALIEVAEILAGIDVQAVRVEWPSSGVPSHRIAVTLRTFSDFAAACDRTKTPVPAAHNARDIEDGSERHYSALTRDNWALTCISFPHHADRLAS